MIVLVEESGMSLNLVFTSYCGDFLDKKGGYIQGGGSSWRSPSSPLYLFSQTHTESSFLVKKVVNERVESYYRH